MKREREKLEKEKEIIKLDMKIKDKKIDDLGKQIREKEELIGLLESKLPADERETKQRLYNY